jgi:hypothetical protein
LLLLAAPLLVSGVHAAPSTSKGTITFYGVITRNTFTPSSNFAPDTAGVATMTMVLPLNSARAMFSSDVLDYFATYARPDTKVISVTYD